MRQFIARPARSRRANRASSTAAPRLRKRSWIFAATCLAACGGDETLEPQRQAGPPLPSTSVTAAPSEPDAGDAEPRLDLCHLARSLLRAEGAAEALCASLTASSNPLPVGLRELPEAARCQACAQLLRWGSNSTLECPVPAAQCPLESDEVRACIEAAAPKAASELPTCGTLGASPPASDAWLRILLTTPGCAPLLLKCPAAQRLLLELVSSMARGQAPP